MKYIESKPSEKLIKCPKCGSNIEVTEGYVQWCEHCSWNLKPYVGKNKKQNIVDRIYKRMGKRLGKELFQSMVKSSSIKPSMTIAKLLAIILSCLIFCISIISIVLLIYLIANFGINVVSILLSLFLMGVAIAAFPRFGKVPKDVLSRGEFPTLYKLLDKISETYNSKQVYGIVINEKFNAAYTEVGIKRRKIVYIGLPLFYILNDEEKVALLSHEIAHGVNGDIARGLITGTAINTLITWYQITAPGRSESRSVISPLTDLIMFGLSKVILLFIIILIHLVYNNSQRAEYLADYIGASISGTEEMKSLLDKLHLDNTFSTALQKAALSGGKICFFNELQTQANMIPKKELKRIKLIERMEGSSLDATHPPTAYRINFMEQRSDFSPKVTLSKADSSLIEKELEKVKDNIERKLIDDYKDFIYYS